MSYDLAPNAEVFASLIYSAVRTENIPAQGNSDKNGMTMRCDNAFLYQTFQGTAFGVNGASPAAFAAACGTAISGAAGAANPSTATFTYGSQWANIPTDQLMFIMRTMRRYTVGGDGASETQYRISGVPFQYAVPVLSGWELDYLCTDHHVRDFGVDTQAFWDIYNTWVSST